MNCQICTGNTLHKFLSLGNHPNPDSFPTEEELKNPEPMHPLDVYFCDNCKLVQLGYIADPKELFTSSFVYTTSSNGELVKNFESLVGKIIKRFNLTKDDFVVDIGSNDGTLLENYLGYNINVLGVDPSEAAKLAVEKNIPTILDFFNEETARKILDEHGKAKIITATNVFAHIKELDSLIMAIKLLLRDDGVFIEESHYLLDLVSKMQYDSIYLEHLRYYSLKPLIYLFNRFEMDVFDAERISTHGGSLRVYVCKRGKYPISSNLANILKQEEEAGLYSKQTFDVFAEKVVENKNKLRALLADLKSNGKKIVGIGAPAKGNTLLNYCSIGDDVLDYLVETSNLKVGKYSPGMHIKILDESQLFKDNPEYALLLSWNLKDIIIPKIKSKGYKGKIIVPIPSPTII